LWFERPLTGASCLHVLAGRLDIQTLSGKKSALIYNPVAGCKPGRRKREIQEAAHILRQAGLEISVIATEGTGDAGEVAHQAAYQGTDLIIVCGGDGTLNEVINGVVGAPVTVAILPGGTANMAAKELGLPHDPVRAANRLVHWIPRKVALGRACWQEREESLPGLAETKVRYFLSVGGIGFDAYVVYKLANDFKFSWGVAAYVVEAVRQALRYEFPAMECTLDGRTLQCTFAVVNHTRRYAGWLNLAPHATFFDNSFEVCLFEGRRSARYFAYAAMVLAGQHLRLPDVQLLKGTKISCAAVEQEQVIYFELDGELAGRLPASFEIVPEALTLLVPPPA